MQLVVISPVPQRPIPNYLALISKSINLKMWVLVPKIPIIPQIFQGQSVTRTIFQTGTHKMITMPLIILSKIHLYYMLFMIFNSIQKKLDRFDYSHPTNPQSVAIKCGLLGGDEKCPCVRHQTLYDNHKSHLKNEKSRQEEISYQTKIRKVELFRNQQNYQRGYVENRKESSCKKSCNDGLEEFLNNSVATNKPSKNYSNRQDKLQYSTASTKKIKIIPLKDLEEQFDKTKPKFYSPFSVGINQGHDMTEENIIRYEQVTFSYVEKNKQTMGSIQGELGSLEKSSKLKENKAQLPNKQLEQQIGQPRIGNSMKPVYSLLDRKHENTSNKAIEPQIAKSNEKPSISERTASILLIGIGVMLIIIQAIK